MFQFSDCNPPLGLALQVLTSSCSFLTLVIFWPRTTLSSTPADCRLESLDIASFSTSIMRAVWALEFPEAPRPCRGTCAGSDHCIMKHRM